MDLFNRVAVITGAASGIGEACARAFVQKGARVVVADIDAEGVHRVAEEIGGLGVVCDVADAASMKALVAETEAKYGPVDVFFSNAGIDRGGGPLDASLETWDLQWRVNVMAHVLAVREVLPGMLQRGVGYLVHTASMAGILSAHANAVYATTKHATVGLAEWLAFTYRDKGIRVSLLAPLGVRTPMLGKALAAGNSSVIGSVFGPLKEPEEVAQQVIGAIEEERFLILTDVVAQEWMRQKTGDIERWLSGMSRIQQKIDSPGDRV